MRIDDRQAGELTKIATLSSVVERNEGYPVELWLTGSGAVVLRAWNECQNNHTDVDLFQLLAALQVTGSALDGASSFSPLRVAQSD